jgi:integrase
MKKGYTYLAQVKRVGFKTVSKSFDTKDQAKKWARSIDRKLDQGEVFDYSQASRLTLRDLLDRYFSENKHRAKKGWRMEEYRSGYIKEDTIADTNCLRLSHKHLVEFRDRRLQTVSNSTFNKDLSFLSQVIETAIHDWEIGFPSNPCKTVKRKADPKPRSRIFKGDEEHRLLEACVLVNKHGKSNPYLKPMVQFTIETAVRKGELFKIKYNDIDFDNCLLHLYETKNSEDRVIPLSKKAIMILKSMPRRFDGRVFPLTRDTLKSWWKTAKKKAKIKDFRWHDLRRVACSRLFEKGFGVEQIQAISGHKDPTILLNTYTRVDPGKLVKKLG